MNFPGVRPLLRPILAACGAYWKLTISLDRENTKLTPWGALEKLERNEKYTIEKGKLYLETMMRVAK